MRGVSSSFFCSLSFFKGQNRQFSFILILLKNELKKNKIYKIESSGTKFINLETPIVTNTAGTITTLYA